MKRGVFLFFIGTFAFYCYIYGFQRQKELNKPEKYKADIRLISVDVIVTKNGEFVKDLTKDDFKLFEDGKKVSISSFELISFKEKELRISEEIEGKKTSPSPKKQLAVIFHDVNFWEKNIKQEVGEIVDELVPLAKRGNEVMVLQLSWTKGLDILQPFTANEELLREAVGKAIESIGSDMPFDDLWLDKPRISDTDTQRLSIGEEKAVLQAYLNIERQIFERAIGGILAACNMMKSLPGRKSILLISEGLTDLSSSDTGTIKRITSTEGVSGREVLDAIHIRDREQVGKIRVFDPFNIMEKKDFNSGEKVIRELIRFANVQNISIYSLDPSTFSSSLFSGTSAEYSKKEDVDLLSFQSQERRKRVQNLSWISEDTGAVAVRGAKRFDRFCEVMRTDLNYYYQLSFKPKRKEADDKYHNIKVKVDRPGVDVRSRKGYTDYSEKEAQNMLIVSAFYSPALFKELPFEAEFIPFYTDSRKYEPWMNIALPSKELFIDRFVEYTPKTFDLHFWIKESKSGEKGFGGNINIPLNINSSFMDYIKKIAFLAIHFKGPKLSFGHKDYQAIFALFDPQTNELGTWESSFSLPDFKEKKRSAFINCVLGTIASNPKKGRKSFSLSKEDGGLEYGQIKFFPQVTGRFSKNREAFVFLQIYLPLGKKESQPEFQVLGEGSLFHRIPAELVAESWNKKSKVWSGIFKLDLRAGRLGDNSLKVEIPVSEEGAVLSKEVNLTVFK